MDQLEPSPNFEHSKEKTRALFLNTYALDPLIYIKSEIFDEASKITESLDEKQSKSSKKRAAELNAANNQLILKKQEESASGTYYPPPPGQQIVRRHNYEPIRPEWHPPWKLIKVLSGHMGWVRSLAVEPNNKWFASGSVDRTIKVWDLASGTLKVTLTGHISPVRGIEVSARSPYLFSCGEDKIVKCWDLEQNKVIRHYHGHLSGIYTLSLHPVLDLLVTAGRDATARVWDIRTKNAVHVLSGHKSTIASVKCQEADPQVITGSMDSTVKLWDLAAGKTMATLTHHKKSVRAISIHPTDFGFISGSTNSIKQWRCPKGDFVQNFDGHNSIINTLSTNSDNVVFSGADNGSMRFWDWKTGHCFQETETQSVPGSLDSEAGIFASTFDVTGLRLITAEADKSIKIYKEDENATPDTHPLNWKPSLGRNRY
ncbi:Pre-mRNA-splicing factor prp46 [Smittium culicis]|uniref:Pre-mRNA-splicing factor prp46 n=1 Tax=Smittium culicis TaxID=133412 RepID=A0A1R1Y7M3_9FUNG|nr:Pre-mRNA-splicing factor prp46 [Smittium culicis]